MTAFAGWRYHIVNRAIETGKIKADPGMVVTIGIIVLTTAIAIILYMFLFLHSGVTGVGLMSFVALVFYFACTRNLRVA